MDTAAGHPAGGRIHDIECLRAVAVIGVLVHHLQGALYYWYPEWLGRLFAHFAFWSGVDLFFAISGFVIARSLLPQLAASAAIPGASWKTVLAFWVRRAFRLLPSAWLWLGLIMLAVVAFNRSGVFGSVNANLWATLAGMANFANFRFADSFMRYEYGASFIYWTLSLEEQFYLLLPLAAWVLRARLAWLLLALILMQFYLTRTTWGMSFRTDALAWGVLLAMAQGTPLWKRMEPVALRTRWVRYPVLLTLFGAAAWLSADSNSATLNWRIGLIAILCGTLVWLGSYGRGYICSAGRLKTVMLWIGSRSYAIYLIHIPAYFFVREGLWRMGMAGTPPPPYSLFIYAASAMLLIAVLAEANYRWIERPLREQGVRLAHRIQQADHQATPLEPRPAPISPT
ncbi:acyltransferase [Pseudoxanthomonas gei]|uniref:Acyltransferase n=1 Tax=Pseudoxanthomonas gei TaxID=1383030 RepID=A0ABX0AEV1_9GAMM|nr:acyltransferase [Pseudoxanthomonas gei]